MKVSVVVPYAHTPRKAKTLSACLTALHLQTHPPDEVLVEQGGVAGELAGIKKSKGDVVLFTDCDCYVPRDWVARHLAHYPETDMVLGAPSRGFKWLSFRNFSVRREIILAFGLNDVPNHDFDLALRILKSRLPYNWVIDRSIRVYHDDAYPVPTDKLFSYAVNCALLMRKYGISPSLEDFGYLLKPRTLMRVLPGVFFALAMPTSAPFRAFRRRGKYRSDTEF